MIEELLKNETDKESTEKHQLIDRLTGMLDSNKTQTNWKEEVRGGHS